MANSLYQKYRPHKFGDVKGQTLIVNALQNIVKSKNPGHAYIFSGLRGTGKTSMARIFAMALDCEIQANDATNIEPCLECNSCKQLLSSSNPDIIEIDAASNNGVDQIRDLREKAYTLPISTKFKIYIIDEVHMLSTQAFNALLKILEEPPAHVIFILVTTELKKIPLTILSRCQKFNFSPISNENIAKNLKLILSNENINYEQNAINIISRISEGSIRDSITNLERIISFTNEELITENVVNSIFLLPSENDIINFINTVKLANYPNIFEFFHKFYLSGIDYLVLAESIIRMLETFLIDIKLNKNNSNINLTFQEGLIFLNNFITLFANYNMTKLYKNVFEAITLKVATNFETAKNKTEMNKKFETNAEINQKTNQDIRSKNKANHEIELNAKLTREPSVFETNWRSRENLENIENKKPESSVKDIKAAEFDKKLASEVKKEVSTNKAKKDFKNTSSSKNEEIEKKAATVDSTNNNDEIKHAFEKTEFSISELLDLIITAEKKYLDLYASKIESLHSDLANTPISELINPIFSATMRAASSNYIIFSCATLPHLKATIKILSSRKVIRQLNIYLPENLKFVVIHESTFADLKSEYFKLKQINKLPSRKSIIFISDLTKNLKTNNDIINQDEKMDKSSKDSMDDKVTQLKSWFPDIEVKR